MYIITVKDHGNFHTNNIGTFHFMREFLLTRTSVDFQAFYDNGMECAVKGEVSDTNRTFGHVDHKPLVRLADALDKKDELIHFILKHGDEYKGRVYAH